MRINHVKGVAFIRTKSKNNLTFLGVKNQHFGSNKWERLLCSRVTEFCIMVSKFSEKGGCLLFLLSTLFTSLSVILATRSIIID